MATVVSIPAESRILLTNVSWSLYQAIVDSRGDQPSPRLSYLDGTLELMSPSFWHEALSCRVGIFVLMLARGLNRPCLDAGSTRWERAGVSSGKEPDSCFYLEHEPEVRGLKEIDLEIHPPPDLAVEIELSNPLADALRIYSGLGVPEVWRYDGDSLRFLHLGSQGTYLECENSRSFPTLQAREALAQLARADEMDQTAWSTGVEDWARRAL